MISRESESQKQPLPRLAPYPGQQKEEKAPKKTPRPQPGMPPPGTSVKYEAADESSLTAAPESWLSMESLYGFDKEAAPTRELSDVEYQALSPKQQSGVDFNTMLSKAVQADLKAWGKKPKPATEENTWGGGKPDTSYAPRTVKLLDSIGYKDSDASLDDFLQLKTAITDSELASLDLPDINDSKPGDWGNDGATAGSFRDDFHRALTKQFETALSKDLGVGTLMSQRNDLLGLPQVAGFGNGPEDIKFQQGFDLLSRSGSFDNQDQVRSILQQSLGAPDVFARFMQYVDTRSMQAKLKNQPLGTSDGASYYPAADFRKLYGLEGKR